MRLCHAFRLAVPAFGAVFLTTLAHATPVEWSRGCMPFIPAAERYHRLPPGLLEAVALTESGQEGAPYPWALNIAGRAMTPRTYEEASALLRRSTGEPRRDVAIGCMQIHMQYHLDKFVEPEWALHPRYNVWYGAALLRQLRHTYGDWTRAVAHYHGSAPSAQRRYLCQVASRLDKIAPATRQALGLSTCRTPSTGRNYRFVLHSRPAVSPKPASLTAARRLGRIIILGGPGEQDPPYGDGPSAR